MTRWPGATLTRPGPRPAAHPRPRWSTRRVNPPTHSGQAGVLAPAPFYGTHTVFGIAPATATIQTPLLALAWELVAEASPDEPGLRRRGACPAPAALRLARARARPGRRRAADDHPPGRVGARRLAQVRRRATAGCATTAPGHFWLIERYRRPRLRRGRDRGRATTSTSRTSRSTCSTRSRCGRSRALDAEHGAIYAARAERTESALLDRCYDERSGLFFDLAGSARAAGAASRPGRRWRRSPSTGMPEDVRRRLVEEHLLRPGAVPGGGRDPVRRA